MERFTCSISLGLSQSLLFPFGQDGFMIATPVSGKHVPFIISFQVPYGKPNPREAAIMEHSEIIFPISQLR